MMRSVYSVYRTGEAGVVMILLISVLLVTMLAPMITSQSDNAGGSFFENENTGVQVNPPVDNSYIFVNRYADINQSGKAIFYMYPLLWAIVGLVIVAGAVVGFVKF